MLAAACIVAALLVVGLAVFVHQQRRLTQAEKDDYVQEQYTQLTEDFLTWLRGGFQPHHFTADPDFRERYGARTSEFRQVKTLGQFRQLVPDIEERSKWLDLFVQRHEKDNVVTPLLEGQRNHLLYGD